MPAEKTTIPVQNKQNEISTQIRQRQTSRMQTLLR